MPDPRNEGAGSINDRARQSNGAIVYLYDGITLTVDTSGVTPGAESSVTFTVADGVLTVIADAA